MVRLLTYSSYFSCQTTRIPDQLAHLADLLFTRLSIDRLARHLSVAVLHSFPSDIATVATMNDYACLLSTSWLGAVAVDQARGDLVSMYCVFGMRFVALFIPFSGRSTSSRSTCVLRRCVWSMQRETLQYSGISLFFVRLNMIFYTSKEGDGYKPTARGDVK